MVNRVKCCGKIHVQNVRLDVVVEILDDIVNWCEQLCDTLSLSQKSMFYWRNELTSVWLKKIINGTFNALLTIDSKDICLQFSASSLKFFLRMGVILANFSTQGKRPCRSS
jgi:hypothetical protein